MAAEQYVLSHPLCFVVNKFGKCENKLLKSALVDFYSPEDLSAAKHQLLKDLSKVQSVSFPHVPSQRQGENRASRDVDDMFTLYTVLDEAESVSFSDLPKYVSDNPDKVPSIRLYEGDFRVLMSLFEKLDHKLNLMESAISNIARDMFSIRSKVTAQESRVQSSQQRQVYSSQAGQCVVNNTNSQSVGYSVVSGTAGLSAITTTGPMTTGNSDATQLMNESADPFTAQVDDAIPTQRSTDWPSLVSTPLIHNNRFSALATTTDDECRLSVQRPQPLRGAAISSH